MLPFGGYKPCRLKNRTLLCYFNLVRENCLRCRRPAESCLCSMLIPMKTRSKLVFLMHPHEIKKVKNGTGRLTALSFSNAEIISGISFEDNKRVQELVSDPSNKPMLLYPAPGACNLSNGELQKEDLEDKQLVLFLLDATWPLAKKMLKLSPVLQQLPCLMFVPQSKSRWKIKKQPSDLCLSTLETVHELLCTLEACGLDSYERPKQLLEIFQRMQEYQLACREDPAKPNYHSRLAVKTGTKQTRRRKKTRSIFFQALK